MTKPGFFRRKSTYIVGIPVLLLVLLVGGPFVYFNFIEGDAPKKLSFETTDSTPAKAAASGTSAGDVDGAWNVTTGSTVGYRVQETLFGQSNTAVVERPRSRAP